MSAEPVSVLSPSNTNLGTSALSSDPSTLPLWDRLTTWAAANKTVVYTAAGVTVIVSLGGVAYYLSRSRKADAAAQDKKRLSKKERRKAKQEREKTTSQVNERSVPEDSKPAPRATTVESDPLEGLPQIDQSIVESLSDEVGLIFVLAVALRLTTCRTEKNTPPN